MNGFKTGIVAAALFALATTAHAGSNAHGPHGGIAAARGLAAARAASHASEGQSGQGGSYWVPDPDASLVDSYQPWPESEMRRFQKP